VSAVFVDTSGFYAFMARVDDHHVDARALLERAEHQSWRLVTTSYVMHESWAIIQGRLGWEALDAWRDGVLGKCEVVWVDEGLHRLGEARCRQARERRLSLTDCVSFEVMHDRGISEAIAWDEHFSRQGFRPPR